MNASETTPRDAAADRRTSAILREACTGGPSPELTERITQALCEAPTRRPVARGARLLAAAALLAGVGAVFATAWAASAPDDADSAAASQQDPQPNVERVRVTNDDVRVEAGEPPATAPAWRRAFDAAPQVPLAVVIAGDALVAESQLPLRNTSAREMLERLALEGDVGMHQFGRAVLLSGDRPGSLPRAARVTLHHDNLRLVDFAKVLHARCGVSLVVPTDRDARLKIDVDDAPWHAVLEATASAFGLHVAHCGAVVALRDPPPGVIAQRNAWIITTPSPAKVSDAFDSVAHAAHLNLVVGTEVSGGVRATMQERTSEGVLDALAAAVSSEARAAGQNFWRVVHQPDLPTTTLTGEHLTLTDFAAYTTRLLARRSCTDAAEPDAIATVAVFAGNAPVPDLVHAVAAAAGRTVRRTEQGDYVLE